MIRGDEVTSRVADHGDIELPEGREDVGAEAVGVRELVPGVVDAAVDAAAQMSLK